MLNAGTPCDHREYAARRSAAESEAEHQLKEALDRKHKSLAAELRNFKAAKLKQLERYHYCCVELSCWVGVLSEYLCACIWCVIGDVLSQSTSSGQQAAATRVPCSMCC